MPILVDINDIEPGMCLATNIVNNYSVLLPHGHTLRERDVATLQRILPSQMIQVIDPVLDQVVEFEDQSRPREISRKVRKHVGSLMEKVSNDLRNGVSLKSENISGIQNAVDEMLTYIQENPVTLALIEKTVGNNSYLQEHSSNVFYLSLVIGNTIRNYIKQERERLSAAQSIRNAMNLTPLAMAAMLHDVGMFPLEKLYQKEGPLTEEEKDQVRRHPDAGAEMLPDSIEPMVRLIIRTHHENTNGTGYPQGLPGDKINIFAKIVRVADAYASAISDLPYREGKTSAQALFEMIYGSYRPYYDPVILKVLSSIVPPLPVGAKLKLENGKWAVVLKQNKKNTFKPIVIVAFDEFGDPIPKDQLESPRPMSSEKSLRVKSFGSQDISFLNDMPQKPELDGIEIARVNYEAIQDFIFP